jgi:hypothetical protein
MATVTTDAVVSLSTQNVVVHPLVLLSIQDHAARAAKGTKKRVVGILLGQDMGAKGYNVANSFAGEQSSSTDSEVVGGVEGTGGAERELMLGWVNCSSV